MPTYGTNVIPGTSVTTQSGGTVNISRAFTASVGLVGGYDASNGNATANEVVEVSSLSEAGDLFGQGSELYLQTRLAYANGATEVHAVPVEETETTETFDSTASGTLSNTPFDPRVNSEHEITAQDTSEGASVEVNIVDEDSPSAPSEANTINLNPTTKDFAADETSTYEITYEYGDYVGGIETSGILDESVRFTVGLTEDPSIQSTLDTSLVDEAVNFNFSRGISGAHPGIDASDYTNELDSERSIVVTGSRAIDDNGNEVRTAGAIAGKLAGNDLGDSATYEELNGIDRLKRDLKPQDAGDFIEKGVLPLVTFDSITVVKGITTSTDSKFSRIHKCEIVDEVTEVAHQAGQQFVGEAQIGENRDDLRDSIVSQLEDMANASPPLLAVADDSDAQPYSVHTSVGETDTETELEIGIDVVDVMESIDVTISVGDVVLNETGI